MTTTKAEAYSPLAAIRNATQLALQLPADDQLASDYIISLIISNVWTPDADPLWGWIIGPPGSYKTELLRPLEDHPSIHYLSSLSGAALVSGYDRSEDHADMSMLPKLKQKVLTIKDFTAILASPDQTIRQIFGDFRDAYDGSYGKHFGTVGERRYKAKFGVLAAVTPTIDDVTVRHVILGERFLAFRVCRRGLWLRANRLQIIRHARRAMSRKASWRANLKSCWQTNLDAIIQGLPDTVDLPDRIGDRLDHLADLLANLRAIPAILRPDDKGKSRAVDPELGTRLVNQLANLCLARCVADGRQTVDESDYRLVQRVAFDTLPPAASLVLAGLWQSHEGCHNYVHIRDLCSVTHIPMQGLRPILDQYARVGLAQFDHATAQRGYTSLDRALWRLTDETLDEIHQACLFPGSKPANH